MINIAFGKRWYGNVKWEENGKERDDVYWAYSGATRQWLREVAPELMEYLGMEQRNHYLDNELMEVISRVPDIEWLKDFKRVAIECKKTFGDRATLNWSM